ncbi:MAG: hypothetical protein JRM80_12285 [Nitrososphaerota archaeon]|nr:hypothetical protein [Nitrososphaerota archaeon]
MDVWFSGRRLYVGALALFIGVFLVSYLVAAPFYDPLVAVVLPVLLAILGLSIRDVETRRNTAGGIRLERIISRLRSAFPWLFLSALAFLLADLVLTNYAVSLFGTTVEQNHAVQGLFANGEALAWVGQQLSPIFIAAALFGLSKSNVLRGVLAIYASATLAYSAGTVINDVLVVYALGGFR